MQHSRYLVRPPGHSGSSCSQSEEDGETVSESATGAKNYDDSLTGHMEYSLPYASSLKSDASGRSTLALVAVGTKRRKVGSAGEPLQSVAVVLEGVFPATVAKNAAKMKAIRTPKPIGAFQRVTTPRLRKTPTLAAVKVRQSVDHAAPKKLTRFELEGDSLDAASGLLDLSVPIP